MFSLTYSSAYDPYHAVFRLLAFSRIADKAEAYPFDSFRIVDFFHCFPWMIKDFPAYTRIEGFQKFRNSVARQHSGTRFDVLPERQFVFERMMPSQYAARSVLLKEGNLVSSGDNIKIKNSSVRTETLNDALGDYCKENKDLLIFLSRYLIRVPLLGAGGLKDRSGLGEFRYDVV